MHKCKVLAPRLGLTVLKDSVVFVDDQQYWAAQKYLEEEVEVETATVKAEAETAVKPKRTRKKSV